MYDDSSNGFRTLIVPLSATSPAVLHSILAVSAFAMRRFNPFFKALALEQKEKTVHYIRSMIRCYEPDSLMGALATAIMLCVFEIKDGCSPVWESHIKGAIALLRSLSSQQKHGSSASWMSGLTWWANKYLAYQYVNGYSTQMIDVEEVCDPLFWLSPDKDVAEIEGLMGCSSILMATIANIRRIAHIRKQPATQGSVAVPDEEVQDIESTLFSLVQRVQSVPGRYLLSESTPTEQTVCLIGDSDEVPLHAKTLILAGEARRQSALMFLYGSVLKLSPKHSAMRSRVSKCLICLKAVSFGEEEAGSAGTVVLPRWGMSPLLWPLFMTGLFSTEHDRPAILDMLRKLEDKGSLGNVGSVRLKLMKVWKNQDLRDTLSVSGSDEQKGNRAWPVLGLSPKDWPLSLG
ncbi:hypothetical protein LTR10_013035 [Elasticomyces elasticus]|uniref:Transcription factor domain-containing protein n=1 Tax=Exophiala sideris TaxID=1016849 RepID=A0ABR0JAK2_9EURO|nr:hypothetical protein LTR10_013035 [Elasticomyces elasticus]KAK5030411.1 hypothetical protein LTS07_005195 [Exophiala sideris]KAK5038464.1 hypothetical protein LTR13_004211 [Exophiala sideris]KAK5060347.1 hypothetical protein LTR69_005664 [Exophiala sideris]KAK5183257.1 hypothetical protein LTR44_004258 [Eurotiomycetes sp. CCFEE 6388]